MSISTSASESNSRRRIIDAAAGLFAEYGFDATSTKAIAEAASVPSGLIFYHFANKESLLKSVFEGDNILGALDGAFASAIGETDPERALRIVVASLYTWLERHTLQAHILFKEISSHRPISKTLREIRTSGIARLAEFLRRVVRDTRKGHRSEVAAQMIASSLLLAVVLDKPENVKQYVNQLAQIVAASAR